MENFLTSCNYFLGNNGKSIVYGCERMINVFQFLIELLMQNFHSSFVATTLRNNGKHIPMLMICFLIFEKTINGKFPG